MYFNWLEFLIWDQEVGGSSPPTPNFNFLLIGGAMDITAKQSEEPPGFDFDEPGGSKDLAFKTTSYYLDLAKKSESIRKTIIPTMEEFLYLEDENVDPLGEDEQSPTKTIVHRYPDRVLFLVTDKCFSFCRYCTRSRKIDNCSISDDDLLDGLSYINSKKEIRDVVVSGGDPLTLSDDKIDFVLKKIKEIKHVEIIRIGTKTPIVYPDRITNNLCSILKKYHPLYINLHFTHPDEITEKTKKACIMLADSGIPLGSQTVLLKGINDNPEILKRLFNELLKIRVKPYYLYQCDKVVGSSHFRVDLFDGINIMNKLIGWTSGMAVPHFIVDLPKGGGKVRLTPNNYKKVDNHIIFTNYKGEEYIY